MVNWYCHHPQVDTCAAKAKRRTVFCNEVSSHSFSHELRPSMNFLELNDGNRLPQIGLGTWPMSNEEAESAVRAAIEIGYRQVDTASLYSNERGVGAAIRNSGVHRSEISVTTKLANDKHGYDSTLRSFDESAKRLGVDYIDLYLIHAPRPHISLYVETWKAFIRLAEEGRVRSIGVSNFQHDQLSKLIAETDVVPAVNQIEIHPAKPQIQARNFHEGLGIVTQSWAPLGKGTLLTDPECIRIAEKHKKTPAQIIIRWHVEKGLALVPKSITPLRLVENISVFDFALDAEDINSLDDMKPLSKLV